METFRRQQSLFTAPVSAKPAGSRQAQVTEYATRVETSAGRADTKRGLRFASPAATERGTNERNQKEINQIALNFHSNRRK